MSLQSTSEAIQSCLTTAQIIQYHAFPFENHIIETSDGFLLGTHRIPNKNPESRVVLIWHGLWYPTKSTGSILNRVFSTSSETFVSNPHMESNLAFHLSTLGFDVWLGNSRGNKYTSHVQHKNTDEAFWDFGIDELAKYDLPETVEFIVKKTGKSKLSYIGFSQGSAQGFIALSSNEVLRSRIDCFIALAAALKPKPLPSKIVTSLVNTFTPSALYQLLGKKSFLPFTQSVAKNYPKLFMKLTDAAFINIFGWGTGNFGCDDKRKALYAHLFCFSSVKNIVHWFEIIDKQQFKPLPTLLLPEPKPYPTKCITTPTHVFYGSEDGVSDIDWMRENLSDQNTSFYQIEGYGHLDFLWGVDAKEQFWDHVVGVLK